VITYLSFGLTAVRVHSFFSCWQSGKSALFFGSKGTVKLLLEAGADANVKDEVSTSDSNHIFEIRHQSRERTVLFLYMDCTFISNGPLSTFRVVTRCSFWHRCVAMTRL